VSDCLGRGFRDIDVETGVGNGRLLAWLGRHGEVLSRQFHDDRVTVHCRLPAALVGRIDPAEASVQFHVQPSDRPAAVAHGPQPPAA
jgi:GTP-binding protein HflX